MKNLECLLDEWRETEPQPVAVICLTNNPALQPRAFACVSFSQISAEERRSEDHIRIMVGRMANPSVEVEPVLVLRTGSELVLLDGHHRLEACRRARRATIPARLLSTDMATAVLASKLVNFGGEKMGLHPDQRRDAAWQILSQLTEQGRVELPREITQRAISNQFSISIGNVNAMLRRLRERVIQAGEYQSDHCDPGTGWPRWPYARNRRYGTSWTPPNDDQRRHQVAANLARKIAEAAEKTDTGILREAVSQLMAFGWDACGIEDAQLAAAELLSEEESDY